MRKEFDEYRAASEQMLKERDAEMETAATDRRRLLEEHDEDRQRILEKARSGG